MTVLTNSIWKRVFIVNIFFFSTESMLSEKQNPMQTPQIWESDEMPISA